MWYDIPEYDNHDEIVVVKNDDNRVIGYIGIHTSGSLPSFGATRIYNYSSHKDAYRDALRLSRLMTYKSFINDFEYGGAKGVIVAEPGEDTKKLLEQYTKQVHELGGKFVTGADVGVSQEDVHYMKGISEHIVGVLNDPVIATTEGIYNSLMTAIEHAYGDQDLSNKSFLIEGAGKIGRGVIEKIYDKAGKIYFTDVNTTVINSIRKDFPNTEFIEVNKKFEPSIDVYSPCALWGTVNESSIDDIKARIIVGGANNQLSSDSVADELFKRGVYYAPDFLVNSGGLLSVLCEYENREKKHLENVVSNIGSKLARIFEESDKRNISPNTVANEYVEKKIAAIKED